MSTDVGGGTSATDTSNDGAATTVTIPIPGGTLAAGDLIAGWVSWLGFTNTVASVADNGTGTANVYTILGSTDQLVSDPDDVEQRAFCCKNVTATNATTITITFDGAVQFRRAHFRIRRGADNTTNPDVVVTQSADDKADWATTTDGITLAITTVTDGCTVLACAYAENSGTAPSTGTGMVSDDTQTFGAGDAWRSEHFDQAIAGAVTMKFTHATAALHIGVIAIAIRPAAGGGGGGATAVNTDVGSRRNRPGRGPYSLGRYFRASMAAYNYPGRVYDVGLAESGSAADSLTSVVQVAGALAEAGAGTDSLSSSLQAVGALTESGSATDTPSSQLVAVGALTETVTAADVLSSLAVFVATLTESGVAVDVISTGGAVYAVSISEAGSATDVIAAVMAAVAAISEAGSATDAMSSQLVAAAALSEAAAATDSINSGSGTIYSMSLTESAAATDALTSVLQAVATLTEVVTAADVLSALAIIAVTLTETVAAVDSVSGSLNANTYNVGLLETASAADVIASQLQAIGAMAETGAAADSWSSQLTASGLLAEISVLLDSITASTSLGTYHPGKTIMEFGAKSLPANGEQQVMATYFDFEGAAYTPIAVRYKVELPRFKQLVIDWTTVTPQASNLIVIPAAQNAMDSKSRLVETRRVTVEATAPGGAIRTDTNYYYLIRNTN